MTRYLTQRKFLRWLLALIGASATVVPILSGLGWAGVVKGIVRNGTTVSPQPEQAIVLIQGLGEGSTASAAEESTPPVRRMPNAVSQARWYILGFALFILGVALVHLYRIDQSARPSAGPRIRARRRRSSGSLEADA